MIPNLLSGKWLFNQTSILSWLFGVPGKASWARSFFFRPKVFSRAFPDCWHFFFCFFGARLAAHFWRSTCGWLVTSNNHFLANWLFHCGIFFSKDFFHLKGLITRIPPTIFFRWIFQPCRRAFSKKNRISSTSGSGCWWFGIQIGRYPENLRIPFQVIQSDLLIT